MLNRRSLARIVQEQNLMQGSKKVIKKEEIHYSDLSAEEQLEDLLKMAVSKKEKNENEIEDISNEIYQKAVEILKKDDILVPFSEN